MKLVNEQRDYEFTPQEVKEILIAHIARAKEAEKGKQGSAAFVLGSDGSDSYYNNQELKKVVITMKG